MRIARSNRSAEPNDSGTSGREIRKREPGAGVLSYANLCLLSLREKVGAQRHERVGARKGFAVRCGGVQGPERWTLYTKLLIILIRLFASQKSTFPKGEGCEGLCGVWRVYSQPRIRGGN